MIGTINNLVSKVVSTVSGPLHTWGPKQAKKKSAKAAKVKGKKCVGCGKKCKCN
jgi:hypothetical protein